MDEATIDVATLGEFCISEVDDVVPCAVVLVLVEVLLVNNEEAAAATVPESVVEARGTAVHCMPPIEVIENPAGRFALVDIVKKKGDASRWKEWIFQPSRCNCENVSQAVKSSPQS